MHWLQGLRSGLQGVEPACAKMASSGAAIPTTTLARRALDLAAREVRGDGAGSRHRRKFCGAMPAWGFSSDVCKHCEVAGCLEACPTGAIVRTGVRRRSIIQPDICNGCAYCVVSCPFGVVQKNEEDGRAFKCTFCSDRQKAGLKPACAKACPTESIKFGELSELRAEARGRLDVLKSRGVEDAVIYDPVDTSVKGIHALFLLRGNPRAYNLPPQPEVPTVYARKGWRSAAVAAGAMLGVTLLAFLGGDR